MHAMNDLQAIIIWAVFCSYEISISVLMGEQQIGGDFRLSARSSKGSMDPLKKRMAHGGIKSNDELNRLTGNKKIINYIKAQRLAWFGHVQNMPDNRMVKKVYEWSPALTRMLGRPKIDGRMM